MSTHKHLGSGSGTDGPVRAKLRLLETTDVHGNLLPYDYYSNQPVTDYSLARTATLIRRARAETRNCLLFDNGDFLQGTPMSDLLALSKVAKAQPHPSIRAMNFINYDAATVGNHEFNFGLEWLLDTLEDARFPITCANLFKVEAFQNRETLFAPYILLKRNIEDHAGQSHPISIGVIGFVPPQTTIWDKHYLQTKLRSCDILETAAQLVPRVKQAGADLIVALAHSGIEPGPARPMMENAAYHLSDVPGIDVIFAGHTHKVFPPPPQSDADDTQARTGLPNQIPCVMAGSRGSHLGVVDLDLMRNTDGAWIVRAAHAETRPLDPSMPADDALVKLLQPAHTATLKKTGRPLGFSHRPLHSYLSLVRPCAATALVNQAQRWEVERSMKETFREQLPVLAASAPFKTGGRGGPSHYTHIPTGPLSLRHAADLYSFPNVLCALRLSGADIREWLERAAIVFHQIIPGEAGQTLYDASVPGHNFDTISGIEYEINLARKPRYNLAGKLINPSSNRIENLRYNGRPILDDDQFIIATNNYRMSGGGPFKPACKSQVVYSSRRMIRDVVADYIAEMNAQMGRLTVGVHAWRFTPLSGTEVFFDTGPGIRSYPKDIAELGARDMGDTETGFARLCIPL